MNEASPITVGAVLSVVSTLLLLVVSFMLSVLWTEIKSLRVSRHDFATMLTAHEVRLDGHDGELNEVKQRILSL